MFLYRLTQAILALVMEIRSLAKVLRLRQPGIVFVRMVSEGENGMLKFIIVLPTPGASDVVSRELNFKIGSGDPQTITLGGAALGTDELEGQDNDLIEGALVDIDDAGNRSEPRLFELILVDTIAPPQPGDVGLLVTAET